MPARSPGLRRVELDVALFKLIELIGQRCLPMMQPSMNIMIELPS
jgi:hypothetical protein